MFRTNTLRSLHRLSAHPYKVPQWGMPLFHNQKHFFSAVNSNVAQQAVSSISDATTPAASIITPSIDQITEVASRSIKIEDMSLFANSYTGDMDVGNIIETVKPLSSVIPHDFIDKLSSISPGQIYNHLDEFSRDAVLYLSNDLGWGMGISIAALSFGIKLFFMPLMFGTQVNSLKMKLLEPETKNYQAQISRFQKQGDYNSVKEAQRQFSALQKRHGIRHWISALSLTQIPVLITWFISLRYLTSMPDKYPQLRTDGMLWFQDLAEQDPYCILPILSATFSYLNISMNPNMGNMATSSPFAKYMKYFKYFPFLTMPVVIFFPSALNMYWAISAFTHMIVALVIKNPTTRQYIGIPKYLPGSLLDKQNQDKVQKVIKAVITDNRLSSSNLAAETAKISSTLASSTAAAPKIKVTSSAAQQVFTNKPSTTQVSANKPVAEKKVSFGENTQVFTNKPSKKK